MSSQQLICQPLNNATLSGAGTTYSNNYSYNVAGTNLYAEVEIGQAPTGTSPTLTVTVQISEDGGANFVDAPSGATSALTAAGATAINLTNFVYPLFRIKYVLGGTTPAFTNVSVMVYAAQ